jgi:glycosyltransferase involved in cell wall biosynthesis
MVTPVMAEQPPCLAIVVPVYNEEPVLPELLRRLGAVCDNEKAYE